MFQEFCKKQRDAVRKMMKQSMAGKGPNTVGEQREELEAAVKVKLDKGKPKPRWAMTEGEHDQFEEDQKAARKERMRELARAKAAACDEQERG